MSNPTLIFGQAVHPDLASLGTLSAIGRINVARIALARPHIADTGLVHGPVELDALPACVCAGTGYHDGQSVECCDECRPDLFYIDQYEQEAYELGVEHARNAASWVIDGNTSHEAISRVVALLDEGDDLDDYLPRRPNLSGEYADELTPGELAAEITDLDSDDPHFDELADILADAYERGVGETFEAECERILRAAL
jgi:hypothetical protein